MVEGLEDGEVYEDFYHGEKVFVGNCPIQSRRKLFKDVVEQATNQGYDSDTVAAIAGGLKGLQIGFHGIPSEWVNKI